MLFILNRNIKMGETKTNKEVKIDMLDIKPNEELANNAVSMKKSNDVMMQQKTSEQRTNWVDF